MLNKNKNYILRLFIWTRGKLQKGFHYTKKQLIDPLNAYVLFPSIKAIWNIILSFIAFIIIARIYPIIPGIGGINRSEFTSQQLISTINNYAGDNKYTIDEIDLIGFGETSYLLIIDTSTKKYTSDYKSYQLEGGIQFLILQEAQKNPIEQLIFSNNKVYKKAFDHVFDKSELAFSQIVKSKTGKDGYVFCINKNLCGKIQFKSKFEIAPLIPGGYKDFCHENIEYQGLIISKIPSILDVEPLLYLKEETNQLFISFPIEHDRNLSVWNGSSKFQFCSFDFANIDYSWGDECFVTKERYLSGGGNTMLGSLTTYFQKETDFYEKLLFNELESCKNNYQSPALLRRMQRKLKM